MGAGETGTDTGDIQMGTLLARRTIPVPGWLKHRYKTDSERDKYHILLSFLAGFLGRSVSGSSSLCRDWHRDHSPEGNGK